MSAGTARRIETERVIGPAPISEPPCVRCHVNREQPTQGDCFTNTWRPLCKQHVIIPLMTLRDHAPCLPRRYELRKSAPLPPLPALSGQSCLLGLSCRSGLTGEKANTAAIAGPASRTASPSSGRSAARGCHSERGGRALGGRRPREGSARSARAVIFTGEGAARRPRPRSGRKQLRSSSHPSPLAPDNLGL